MLGLHHNETVFTNWFYPQNSELLHAVGITIAHRDTLSLFINFGWLALAFLSAWCIGRPYGRGHLSVLAVAILLECHTLVVREPGAAKNDVGTAALVLAALAILINAWAARESRAGDRLAPGWPLAVAGLAVGSGGGDEVHRAGDGGGAQPRGDLARPAGRRRAVAGWWFLPALAGGRVLVPAQPDRRRQPAARDRPSRARSPCPTPSGCKVPGQISASSTTPPTPASGATTSLPGFTTSSGRSGR